MGKKIPITKEVTIMPRILFYDFNYPELQLDSDYPVGGATVQLHSWLKGFVDKEWDVGVAVPEESGESLDKKITFIHVYKQNYGIAKLRWLYYRIPRLMSSIKKYNPDFIYNVVPSRISIILFFICKILKIKLIVRVSNDILVDERIKTKYSSLLSFLLRIIYKKTDFVICQNDYQYNELKKLNINNLFKITNPFAFSVGELSKSPNNSYVAWLGIFQYQKNLPLLEKIVSTLPNIHFKIAGSKAQKLDDDTKEAIKNLEKKANVEFVGYLNRKDVISFLSKAKILLNTSHYEGFSNTFLEAFSTATPVICPQNVDPCNIIEKNRLGFSYECVSVATDKITNFFDDKELYKEFSKNVFDYIKENHNYKKLTENLIGILLNDKKNIIDS
jgi:glycosyltransferase involved in cell wall biosynthesis